MQLQNVAAWQSNFSTQPLYRDIVDHITATIPTGAIHQMSQLSGRVDAMEGYLQVIGTNLKKRKTTDTTGVGAVQPPGN